MLLHCLQLLYGLALYKWWPAISPLGRLSYLLNATLALLGWAWLALHKESYVRWREPFALLVPVPPRAAHAAAAVGPAGALPGAHG